MSLPQELDYALTWGDKHNLGDVDAYVSSHDTHVKFTSELVSSWDVALRGADDDLVADVRPEDEALVRWLDGRGFLRPRLTVAAARRVDLHMARVLALLTMETGNGRNVYGHDPVPAFGCYDKGGGVTEANYLCYKRARGGSCSRGCQGVGPTQLTWFEFQDRADRLGGCWKPYYNQVVGFGIFRAYRESGDTIWEAARRYNGSAAYADRFVEWNDLWEQRLEARND